MLGALGSILFILTIVPVVGYVLGIIGYVLLLLALKDISEQFQEPKIFTNAMLATIVGIVGFVTGLIIGWVGVLSFFSQGFPTDITGLIFSFLLALAVAWVFAVLSSVFLRRSLVMTGDKLNIGLFKTAGLLILIGAILTIIFVGGIIALVGFILLAAAFFQIKTGT